MTATMRAPCGCTIPVEDDDDCHELLIRVLLHQRDCPRRAHAPEQAALT